MIPLLRVTTEFNFKRSYGPLPAVRKRLEAVAAPLAAMVDVGSWGHVSWAREMAGSKTAPAFGSEIIQKDGTKFWALATDLPDFYQFASGDESKRGGAIVFNNGVLTEPESFDFIDLNHQSSVLIAKAIKLHKQTGKPLALAPPNNYPAPEDFNRFMAWASNQRACKQHILSESEVREAYSMVPDKLFEQALQNTYDIAERIRGLELPIAPIIKVEGDFEKIVSAKIKERFPAGWGEQYQKRYEREMELIKAKEYESYFLVVADLVQWAKGRMMVGPGRGSSAGSLVCYLLNITQVDPIKHNLLFERFIDVNRNDLPDIDIDLSDKDQAFKYLSEKYGADHVAKVGSINRLKPRSVVAHVRKKLNINPGETFGFINELIEYSPGDKRFGHSLEDTFRGTKEGQRFIHKRPEAKLMAELENHASHTGVHAGGILVCNEPITRFCIVQNGVAQLDKIDAEDQNLLKIDALGLRTLAVLEDAGCQQLYDLPLDDPDVFAVINDRRFAGIFQFEGYSQRKVAKQVHITEFEQLDHITALSRPGPLAGGAFDRYISQAPVEYAHNDLKAILESTKGVILYQEQVMKIVRTIGRFSWEDTSKLRRLIGKSKGKEAVNEYAEKFLTGASESGIEPESAKQLWESIITFGGYGMNKSHTTCYAVIAYWCAWMKAYHPAEFAAALLRNAKDDEQVIETLRELADENIDYIAFDIELSEQNWTAKNGKLIGGFMNLHGIGAIKAAQYIEKRNNGTLTEDNKKALLSKECKFAVLKEGHEKFRHIYDDPNRYINGGRIKELGSMADRESGVVIAKLIEKQLRDENEPVRLARREGEYYEGQTKFVDLMIVDDSITNPIRARIQRRDYESIGIDVYNKAVNGETWFLVRGQWLEKFSMLSVEAIKVLE